MQKSARSYKSLLGRERIETVIGYVCGIIYNGSEWLDNGSGLCAAYGKKGSTPKKHKTEAAAQKRLAKMGWDDPKYQKFVRPYILESYA